MKKCAAVWACAGFLILSQWLPCVYAEKVRHVIDGDTVVLENHQRVRLIGVDAPEIDHPARGMTGEFYGDEAKTFLKKTVEGKDVRLEAGPEPFDSYGRRLAFLFLGDLSVNAELIRLGYAAVYRKFEFPYKQDFLDLEAEARKQELGIWNEQLKAQYVPQAYRGPHAWVWLLTLGFGLFLWRIFRTPRG